MPAILREAIKTESFVLKCVEVNIQLIASFNMKAALAPILCVLVVRSHAFFGPGKVHYVVAQGHSSCSPVQEVMRSNLDWGV